MKRNAISYLYVTTLLLGLLTSSCREDEFQSRGTNEDEALVVGSNVADLLFRLSLNDGSSDNILDRANCFSIQLPVTVTANGTTLNITEESEFDRIEAIFEEDDNDDDLLEFDFPITIILADYQRVEVEDRTALNVLADGCPGENEEDVDIECIDIVYPLTISTFDRITELFDSFTLDNDEMLYDMILELNDNEIVNINFPIKLTTSDEAMTEITDMNGLETFIESLKDSCDEDDDNDFNDDDCEDCSIQQLQDIWSPCNDWRIAKLLVAETDELAQFSGVSFILQEDGDIFANNGPTDFLGSWSAEGEGSNIQVTIDLPNYPDLNASWNLNSLLQSSNGVFSTQLLNGNDVLRFQETCTLIGNENVPPDLEAEISDGLWLVNSYFVNGTDNQTVALNGYGLNFNVDRTVEADNGEVIGGSWDFTDRDIDLQLDFDAAPFEALNKVWRIFSISDTRMELRELGADSNGDLLVLSKQAEDCGDCSVSQLLQLFSECLDWRVNRFELDGENLQPTYENLSFKFETFGDLTVQNGEDTILGTWSASGSGNDIDVVLSVPGLNDFNFTWDLNTIFETPADNVELRDGGNILRFQEACSAGKDNVVNDPDEVDETDDD